MKHAFRRLWISAGVALLVASCGTGPNVGAPPSGGESPAPVSSPEDLNVLRTNYQPPAERGASQKSIERHAKKRAAAARPGLATGWGESVNSPMEYTGFVRSSNKPYGGVSMIRYNDSDGAEAMGARRGKHDPKTLSAANGLIQWGVKSKRRKLGQRYWKRGRMVVGKKGQRYSLVVKNLSRTRLETVMSVDGVDVVDGRAASTKKRGYIVRPGQTLEVKGFRTSDEAVAAFEFSSVPQSYANLRHGDTRNVGVMGLAVFTEKGIDPWGRNLKEIQQRGSARAFADAPTYRARN